MEDGTACGVQAADGRELRAKAVMVNADPFRLRQLAGGPAVLPTDFNARLDSMRKDGTTMKARCRGDGLAAVLPLGDCASQ